ncbi:DUF973 family protein [Sulfurisphaera tokodaii]|uniref:Uncharacterized protein n=2 Tax=Sulfurisphaera tokodaii TaxID=111955 RepID=Q970F8_SULTO|nr:DUF973 family protein [Sulfurisphaera tokodaii]BAB66715.1 hypothetical protein STK_16340 [Sulfurisphaera tokodaii str. 7]HII74223.1 DUF973 family protein [Sulfurisphaera tokodaii]
MRGLSEGIVHLIILTAAVLMTLIVVAFIFGLFGGLSPLVEAYQVYDAVLYSHNGHYYLNFTIRNNLPITITNVEVVGTPLVNSTNIQLQAGTHSLTVEFPQSYTLTQGSIYTVVVSLGNGNSIDVSASYE